MTEKYPPLGSLGAIGDGRSAEVSITMGCGDACPIFPGKRYLDWDLTDPAGKSIDQVRPIIDDIDHRARAPLAELLEEPARAAHTTEG